MITTTQFNNTLKTRSIDPSEATSSLIILEGNIGVGKSTFLKMLIKELNSELIAPIYEPHAEWQNIGGHNLLDHFYKDSKRWAYTFQLNVLITRILACQQKISQRQESAHRQLYILERSVYSDAYILARNAYELGSMTPLEWELYQRWFFWLINQHVTPPAAFIYLRAEPEICYQRLQQRNRSEEAGVSLEYLKRLHEKHDALFTEKSDIPSSLPDTPVLTLAVKEDFEHTRDNLNAHKAAVITFLEKHGLLPISLAPRMG